MRRIARTVDYVAPLVYPSHWGPGEFGVADPNRDPYAIVNRSLKAFQKKVDGHRRPAGPLAPGLLARRGPPTARPRSRPRSAGPTTPGVNEWIMWDPNVTYTPGALIPEVSPGTASPPRRDARPLAALAVVTAALVVPVYLLAVRTGLGQRLDERPTGDLVDEHQHVLRTAEKFLDIISVGSLAALGTTLVLVALLRGRVMVATAAAAAILGANVTTQALKRLLDRPDLTGPGPSSPAGFPSGHTTVAMSLALALVLVAPSSWRTAAALAGAAYAAAVGLAVIGLGWHRPSDVAAAYLVATAWAAACAAVVRRLAPRARAAPRPPLLSARAGGALAVAGVAAFAIAVAVAAARKPDLVSVAAVHTSLVVLTALALALGLALVAAFTALLGAGVGLAAHPARAGP